MPKILSLKPEERARRLLERIMGKNTIPAEKLRELTELIRDNDRLRAAMNEPKRDSDEP